MWKLGKDNDYSLSIGPFHLLQSVRKCFFFYFKFLTNVLQISLN